MVLRCSWRDFSWRADDTEDLWDLREDARCLTWDFSADGGPVGAREALARWKDGFRAIVA
jgi:hypothetical protein